MPGQGTGIAREFSASIAKFQDLQDECSKPEELVGLLEPAKTCAAYIWQGVIPREIITISFVLTSTPASSKAMNDKTR